MRLLLDEMWSSTIAEELRSRGHDVVAAAATDQVRGLSDEALLAYAKSERRVVATRDVGDFSELALRLQAEGRDHYGVILVSHRFSTSKPGIGRIVRALEAVLREHPGDDDLVSAVIWLSNPSEYGWL